MNCYLLAVTIILTTEVWFRPSDADKFAAWTFDRRNGTTIVPEPPSSINFYGDASILGTNESEIFPVGKIGNCVLVDGKEFSLAKNLSDTCVTNMDLCGSGLSLSFYLKVVSWNNATEPVIFRTMSEDRGSAGIYFGRSNDGMLEFYMAGSSGSKTKTFSSTLPLNRWVKFEFFFAIPQHQSPINFGNEPAPGPEFVQRNPQNFVVGSENGPTFYLDELSVFYSTSMPQNSPTADTSQTHPWEHWNRTVPSISSKPNLTNHTVIDSQSSTATHSRNATGTATATMTTTHGNQSNIWIPILIAVVSCTVGICVIFLICLRRRHRKRKGTFHGDDEMTLELAEVKNNYFRASTIEPYRDLESNEETTDGNHAE